MRKNLEDSLKFENGWDNIFKMNKNELWKNFALGIELDSSGMFIYNGLKAFNSIDTIYHPVDIFEIVYNLSVGIERLFKIAIILVEHNDEINLDELEKSLITHNTIELYNRLNKNHSLNYPPIQKEFLSILTKFYMSYRYNRFSSSSIPNIEPEKEEFIIFFQKHLRIKNEEEKELLLRNTNQTKLFLGRIIKKITRPVFELIKKRASELNIYTDEIRSDSKALKIFLSEKLDFLDENRTKKELILFLINKNTNGRHIDFLKNYDQLELDPELVPEFIKGLLKENYLGFVKEYVEIAYEEIKNKKDRLNFLEIIDNEYLTYDPSEE